MDNGCIFIKPVVWQYELADLGSSYQHFGILILTLTQLTNQYLLSRTVTHWRPLESDAPLNAPAMFIDLQWAEKHIWNST